MQHPEFHDILTMVGYEKDITIGEDEHNTENWNPMLWAIHVSSTETVKYFIDDAKVNLRLALMNPEKREQEYEEKGSLYIETADELYGVLVAVNDKHAAMFELLWNSMRNILTEEHFKE